MTTFDRLGELEPRPIFAGVVGRAVHGDRITLGVIELDPGVELPEHSHPNEQLGILLSGSLLLNVAGESRTLRAGETWRIPADVPHSGRAGPEGAVAIDVFGPPRGDWQDLEPLEQRPLRWP
jgi:quercetin dioxygenase-like cupin family protein